MQDDIVGPRQKPRTDLDMTVSWPVCTARKYKLPWIWRFSSTFDSPFSLVISSAHRGTGFQLCCTPVDFVAPLSSPGELASNASVCSDEPQLCLGISLGQRPPSRTLNSVLSIHFSRASLKVSLAASCRSASSSLRWAGHTGRHFARRSQDLYEDIVAVS